MNFYWQLFISFFKIGAFTLGGGYVMIPLIEKEVVDKRKWLGSEEFNDALALAQTSPGPISINTAVFVGYKLRGGLGVAATVLGTALPSFICILLIAIFFTGIKDNEIVQKIFRGIRPAVVALIAVPVVNMLKDNKFKLSVVIIAIAAALAVWLLGVSPVIVIIAAGIFGILYNSFIKKQC